MITFSAKVLRALTDTYGEGDEKMGKMIVFVGLVAGVFYGLCQIGFSG